MLTFRLTRAGRVIVMVTEVFPTCNVTGSFAVSGHAGLNRVAFGGRVQGHMLRAGTYRIRTSGAATRRVTLVVVDHVPSPAELAAARTRNSCQGSPQLATLRLFPSATATPSALASVSTPASVGSYGALGSSASRGNEHSRGAARALLSAIDTRRALTNPVVIVALALAMLLLGVAALPASVVVDPRLGQLLIRHRLDLAAFGLAALATGVVAMILG
jgi:hypothetical protein